MDSIINYDKRMKEAFIELKRKENRYKKIYENTSKQSEEEKIKFEEEKKKMEEDLLKIQEELSKMKRIMKLKEDVIKKKILFNNFFYFWIKKRKFLNNTK